MREGNWEIKVQAENVIDYKEINNKVWLNNIKVSREPKLTINAWCHNHIKALHKKYPSTEWTAICRIVNKWNWEFEMVDMIHPQQKTTSWEVETTDEWMEWAVKYLIDRWEDLWEWNCILHSHHHMGCFRSGTDDKARLWMNDWRMLMWAVVTAYSWDNIDYKWCLNFYKPYPIEIDCQIEYDTVDLYEQKTRYWNDLDNRIREEYNNAILTDEKLKDYKCEYDYDNVLLYLWIDITDELKKNAEVIQTKMPCKWYEDRLKEIMEDVKEKVQKEMTLDESLIEWSEWSEWLVEQLEKAKVINTYTTTYPSTYHSYPEYNPVWNFYNYDYWKEYLADYWDKYEEEYCWFNKDEYPTKEYLCGTLWIDEWVRVKVNHTTWLREVYDRVWERWYYLWDMLDDVLDTPEYFM